MKNLIHNVNPKLPLYTLYASVCILIAALKLICLVYEHERFDPCTFLFFIFFNPSPWILSTCKYKEIHVCLNIGTQ